MAAYNDKGQEVPDQTPVAVPFNFGRPLSLHEQIKRFVRSELSQQAQSQGQESFEEADDFDVDEDPDPISPYEIPEAQVEWPMGEKDADADPPQEPSRKAQDESEADEATPTATEGRGPSQRAAKPPEDAPGDEGADRVVPRRSRKKTEA